MHIIHMVVQQVKPNITVRREFDLGLFGSAAAFRLQIVYLNSIRSWWECLLDPADRILDAAITHLQNLLDLQGVN